MAVPTCSSHYDNKHWGHKGAADVSREKLLAVCLAGWWGFVPGAGCAQRETPKGLAESVPTSLWEAMGQPDFTDLQADTQGGERTCPGVHRETLSAVCSFIKILISPTKGKALPEKCHAQWGSRRGSAGSGDHVRNQEAWWHLQGREISCRARVKRQEDRHSPRQRSGGVELYKRMRRILRAREDVQTPSKAPLGLWALGMGWVEIPSATGRPGDPQCSNHRGPSICTLCAQDKLGPYHACPAPWSQCLKATWSLQKLWCPPSFPFTSQQSANGSLQHSVKSSCE